VEFGPATGAPAEAPAREGKEEKQQQLLLHPAPDPLLLAVRASVSWSRRRGQELLPADEPVLHAFEAEYDRRIELVSFLFRR
jgi:hypothetical protein